MTRRTGRTEALEQVRRAREQERLDRQAHLEAKATEKRTRTCPTCGTTFETPYPNKKYCSPEHRPTPSRSSNLASTSERGYGPAHRKLRKDWAPYVEAGEVDCHAKVCFAETRRIEPGTPWDLGHTEDRSDWTGPEHEYCNRKEPQLRGDGPDPDPVSRAWDV